MKLRSWQLDCVKSAKTAFSLGQKNYLALATPGAGKTVMAAFLAKTLLDNGQIDHVICFAPSKTVTKAIAETFSSILGRGMDGFIGDVGAVYTYQFLAMNNSKNWQILSNHRVLLVFDEIHHAGGSVEALANSWGREILTKLKDKASFILSMTGTPWRSDNAPITLARYIEPDWRVACDYTYGLAQAVRDGVCRAPEIRLFDNSCLRVESESYCSISDALENSDIRYADLLDNTEALNHILKQAVSKLASVRMFHPDAGGLVVAKSIGHAQRIIKLLRQQYQQTAVLVTYQELNPDRIIERFREDNTQWIVSISMVSEGTDIPRLRLCVHLSTIKTELFFRQVLGRVLRTIPAVDNKSGWLYTFAESQLLSFAERIQVDIPDHKCKLIESMDIRTQININLEDTCPDNDVESAKSTESELEIEFPDIDDSMPGTSQELAPLLFRLDGQFRHEVFSIF
ncbi:MAG: DEAD/DEAH box helicase family protein [Idiomarina sp.]|nr:DEAD/DEAH box helicase family protein [Idiomarina sp.]